MANSVLLPPDLRAGESVGTEPTVRPLDTVRLSGDLGEADQGVLRSLVNSVRDQFFPEKLPPLVLESQPIAVVDRMTVKRDPTSVAIAVGLHVVAFVVIGYFVAQKVGIIKPTVPVNSISLVEPPPPPKLPKALTKAGGGGGQVGPAPVSRGNPPKFDPVQVNPPKAPPLAQPKINIPVTIDVDPNIKMAKVDSLNLGSPNSPLVGTSLGNGHGTGIGSGDGAGLGPGRGGNTGGGVRRPGGSVSAPEVLFKPDAEFSEEARKAKVAGNVLVYLQVDQNGKPIHVRVLRGIGLGLDEKAIEAVRQYKFKPAMENGHPVICEVNVEVNFQIF